MREGVSSFDVGSAEIGSVNKLGTTPDFGQKYDTKGHDVPYSYKDTIWL